MIAGRPIARQLPRRPLHGVATALRAFQADLVHGVAEQARSSAFVDRFRLAPISSTPCFLNVPIRHRRAPY